MLQNKNLEYILLIINFKRKSYRTIVNRYLDMKDYGLVSIITPTYNCGRFIAETIESVLAQTYTNWEMLIVDDCSTDNTKEIVEQYQNKDPRIKYQCLARNSGAAVARNIALRMSKGRWMAFLDSDDLWKPEKLEHQLDFMVKNNYGFTCTEREVIDEVSKVMGIYVTGPDHVSKFGMYCYCWVGCLTAMYDRNVVGLVQIPNLKKNNDYAMWLKVIRKCDCYLLKESLAFYRIRKGSISHDNLLSLIKSHYILFRQSEGFNVIVSSILTLINCICAFKKKRYRKKI